MKERVVNGIGFMLGGNEIDPAKKTLVFVHGAGSHHSTWEKQVEYFSRDYNAVAINLPGHGLGERKSENTVEAYADSVQDLLDGLGLEKVVLAGLSMGGAITQFFALTRPERLHAIILFSTGAKLRVMPDIFRLIKEDFEAYVNFLPKFAFAESTPREIIEPVVAETRRRDPEVVFGDFQACDGFDVRDRVGDIRLPCLLISGSEDKLTPPKYMDFLHERIKGSRLIRLDNAGHILALEKPSEVNAAVLDFLESLQGGIE